MKTIAVLGSTGSIGTQTLEVARANGDLKIAALAAGRNVMLLEKQIREFSPRVVAVWEEEAAKELKTAVSDLDVKIVTGMDGLIEISTLSEVEVLVTAIVGMIGIRPTVEAIKAGKDIALANKETLVTAGHIIMPLAKEHNVRILPVDSEHSAIFQSLNGEHHEQIDKLLITASGGPFRGKKRADLEKVKVEDALKHPNWSMGAKITIDSATLMNKGLEVIEAMRLYRLPVEQVDVVIHRQSIVHSLVEYRDGAMIAQLGTPDMKLPIRYAFTWPHRAPSPDTPLDLLTCGDLTFRAPDLDAFPCLRIARQCAKAGGTACAIMNGANEAAVALFLQERVGFNDIPRLVESALSRVEVKYAPDLPDILEADRQARAAVLQTVGDMV